MLSGSGTGGTHGSALRNGLIQPLYNELIQSLNDAVIKRFNEPRRGRPNVSANCVSDRLSPSQRQHRVDSGGATGRHVARDERNQSKQERNRNEREPDRWR